ncbi:MAG: antitoxin VbhA family protein [Gracilibacteraceae bacterium]|jgi:hypothetical protein|nr:antitoxin VbhA family protein [Gracilibacteraceae bacterium]
MVKSYSYKIADTTKVQREKYVNDAISISVLDAPEPSPEAKQLMRDYVDGKRELADARRAIIEHYREASNA